jgi:hypothetical protein
MGLIDTLGHCGIGPHVIGTSPAARRWASKAGIVKAIDNPAILESAQPGAVRIHRHYFKDQGFSDVHGIANAIIGSLNGYRHPLLFVEVFNEFAGRMTESLSEHAAFLTEIVPILHAAGVLVCGPCWGTGAYEQGDWDYLRSVKWCGLDAIALHGYWDAWHGPTIWNALRFRTYWKAGDPGVMVTECGVDRVRDGDNGTMIGSLGWKMAQPSVTAAQMAQQYADYGRSLTQPGEIGATAFTAAPTPDWVNYTTDDFSDLIPGMTIPTIPQVSTGVIPMATDERERYYRDLFRRFNVPFNPGSGIQKHWMAEAEKGNFLGPPMEQEHPTENGKYVYQAFASAVLTYDTSNGAITEGLPPLS